MTLIQKIFHYFTKKQKFHQILSSNKIAMFNKKSLFFYSSIFVFFVCIFGTLSFIENKNQENANNAKELAETSEFSKLTNFFISKINSPYTQINYPIRNNDTIEKILKKYEINSSDIQIISSKLKQKKLSNIYSGRKLSMVIKKLEDGSKTVVNLVFPINNTNSIEIRKTQNDFIVKENILELYKKEVVVKNVIKNNLYSSALEKQIEPNIIIEFARIFGFEVDFQRDIRKDDWFEIYYEKFIDDSGKVRDTGKIIYASMYVNKEEINLYNFKDKGQDEYYDIKGKSITKSLMKTPINGARLSSSYGMRKHPILGYNKMHRGTDFRLQVEHL